MGPRGSSEEEQPSFSSLLGGPRSSPLSSSLSSPESSPKSSPKSSPESSPRLTKSEEKIDIHALMQENVQLAEKLGIKFVELQSMISDKSNNSNNYDNYDNYDIGETPDNYGKTETANMMEFIEDNNDGTSDSITFIPFNRNKKQHNSDELMEILRKGKNLPHGTIEAKNGNKYVYNK